ncbi:MAG: winged helix-turn-helix domain-containing protein [Pseudomonadota bacterium]
MMRWQIAQFEFDENTRQLSAADGSVTLEPKAAALLTYFCQHPGRDIHRDELLQAVWYGQTVADNSINRVVVQLRKALGDEDKSRRYIATIPKLGYRFIADVAPAGNDASKPAPSRTLTVAQLLVAGLLIAVLVVLYRSVNRTSNAPAASAVASIVPLSRLAVAQSDGDLARDGRSLLYTARTDAGNRVYLRSGDVAEPVLVSPADGDGNFATWSHDASFFVYLFSTATQCEFRKVMLRDGVPQPPDVLYQCRVGSYTEFSLSPDDSKLYFVERPMFAAPYAAFELDLVTRSKRRLSQPVALARGNHFIDMHAETGVLLLLSDSTPGKTHAYELDPKSDSFVLRHSFGYSVPNAIWSHRDGFIVHPSMHPSYALLETQLTTGESVALVSDSRRIRMPRRIVSTQGDSRDYLFTSYLTNRDIVLPDGAAPGINSAVMDYLPALSHAKDRLAFVSKRSGDSQIWIKDLGDGTLQSVPLPDTGRLFLELAWSADDQQLLANTDSGVFVYSFEHERVVHDIALPLPAYAVRWRDADTLSFSHYDAGRWQAFYYHLNTAEQEAVDARWAFTVANAEQELRFDQQLNAFRNAQPWPAVDSCVGLVWRYQLRVQLDGDAVYCNAANGDQDLLQIAADGSMARLPDVVSRYEFYSVVDGVLAVTRVTSSSSDIMRTQDAAAIR